MPNEVLTKWDDLSRAGYPTSFWREEFKKRFGKTPNTLSLNDGICVEYGKYCYNIQGVPTYRNRKTSKALKVGAERIIENMSSDPATYNVTLSTTMSQSCSVIVTESSEFSFGNSITLGSEALGLSTELSTTFTVKNEIGSESSTSTEVNLSDTLTITVQPQAKKVIKLMVEWTELEEEIEIPIDIDGWVGGKYDKKVKDHYYWYITVASAVGSTPESKILGKVDASYNIKGFITVDDEHVKCV